METDIKKYIVSSRQNEWKPLVEAGVERVGVYVKVLRFDEETQRAPAILSKFEAGASYPYHNHPGGEEILVLEGSCEIEGVTLSAGDYLYTPKNFKHGVRTESGCILFLSIPEEVEVL